jgi:hypothetical protein
MISICRHLELVCFAIRRTSTHTNGVSWNLLLAGRRGRQLVYAVPDPMHPEPEGLRFVVADLAAPKPEAWAGRVRNIPDPEILTPGGEVVLR